jgi:hypothetical protein
MHRASRPSRVTPTAPAAVSAERLHPRYAASDAGETQRDTQRTERENAERQNTHREKTASSCGLETADGFEKPCVLSCFRERGRGRAQCDCEPGFFGEACQIEPVKIQASGFGDASRYPFLRRNPYSPQVESTLLEGHFDYYELSLPAGAPESLSVRQLPRRNRD